MRGDPKPSTPEFRPGDLVRVNPSATGMPTRHWGRGRIISVTGGKATVKLFPRHPRHEVIGVEHLKLWASANASVVARQKRT